MPSKIALFASGSGSNVENIITYFKQSHQFDFPVIISNKKDAFVHERAKKFNIPTYTFTKEDFLSGEKIVTLLQQLEIDYIVLAGFLLRIPSAIINAYTMKIINIHPALLPKFGGKGMYGDNVHKAVVDANETESGITIHYVNENYDEGNVIFQAKCLVTPNDTFETVASKVHQLEYQYFPQTIQKLWSNSGNTII